MTSRIDALYSVLTKVAVAVAIIVWLGVLIAMGLALANDVGSGSPVAQSKELVTPLIAVTGVVIAVLVFLRDRKKIERDQAEARSKVLYEQAKAGLESAYDLLKDLNNDRIIWIRAARVMASALRLGRQIESREYGEAYRLAEDAVRARLYDVLMEKNERGERVALRAAFFFGHPGWRTSQETLEDLAKLTSTRGRIYSVTPQNPVPEMMVSQLSPESVMVIMGFLQFPRDYPDSLNGVDRTTHTEWPDTYGPLQGAKRYLSFLDEHHVANGRVRRKGESGSGIGCG